MRLTLFDLDHTLIPFDSTLSWMGFLGEHRLIEPRFATEYLARCRRYLAGEGSVASMQEAALAPLAGRACAEVAAWQRRYTLRLLGEELPEAALRLVRGHMEAGDTCAIVTNTADVVARTFADALGVPHLLSSRAQAQGGRFTGELVGEPCHAEAKLRSLLAWLGDRGQSWVDVGHCRFYSDSISDLPLLSYVAEPIAVAPDRALRAHAERHGWRIIEALG